MGKLPGTGQGPWRAHVYLVEQVHSVCKCLIIFASFLKNAAQRNGYEVETHHFLHPANQTTGWRLRQLMKEKEEQRRLAQVALLHGGFVMVAAARPADGVVHVAMVVPPNHLSS